MKKLIFIYSFLILAAPLFGQETHHTIPLISVEGFSERKIEPDETVFSMRLVEKALQVSDAVNALNLKANGLSESLRKSKIQNYSLIADNYSVDVHRKYLNGYSKDSGYQASQNLRILTGNKIEDFQKIIETIQKSGNISFNIIFQISESTKKSIEKELLIEALNDAQSKAKLIAETLGIKNIQVHHVSLNVENSFFQNTTMLRSNVRESEMLVSPELQKLQKRVFVNFTY